MARGDASLRSAGLVSILSFTQLFIQFLFQVVLAKYYGDSASMDAYLSAIALPTVVSSVLLGSFGYAFVPLFSGRLKEGQPREAWEFASSVAMPVLLVSAVATGIIWLAAEPLARLLYPGFEGERLERTGRLLRLLSWLVLTNGLIGFLQSIYHSCRKFLLAAAAPVLGTLVTLTIVVIGETNSIEFVAQAVVTGNAVAVLLHAPLVVRYLRPRFQWDRDVVQCFRLLVPLVFGAVYYQLDPLVDRHLASSLPTGMLSHMGYAWRMATALVAIGTSGLSIVVFPSFASHWAAGNKEQFRGEVSHAMRCLCVILIPIAVGLICYSRPLIQDLFERGEFGPTATGSVARLLVFYLGMIVAAGLGEITAKVFYAVSDTRTPVMIGVCGFTLGIVLKFLLTPVAGVAGIVVATSVYRLVNVTMMTTFAIRRVGFGAYAGVGWALLRGFGAAATAALLVQPIVYAAIPFSSLMAAACGAVIYIVLLRILGDEFAIRMTEMVRAGGRSMIRWFRPKPSEESEPSECRQW